MAFLHGKSTRIALQGYDLTAFASGVDTAFERQTSETTTFGNDSRTYVVGLGDGSMSVSGFFDGADDSQDEQVFATLGTEDGAHLMVVPNGDGGPGTAAMFLKGDTSSYEIATPVDDVVSFTLEVQGDGGAFGGVTLHPAPTGGWYAVSAADNTDAGAVDGSASSSDGATAQLHVVSNTLDGNLVVTVEDSADDAVFTSLAAFTTVSAATTTAEQVTATGTVERYVRVNIDASAATTGAARIAVAFRRG